MADMKEKETPKKPNPPETKPEELKEGDLDKAAGGVIGYKYYKY